MAKQGSFSLDTFLTGVQAELKGLDSGERREILEELSDHLEDSVRRGARVGTSTEAAVERAVAAMGDPAQVGRRLRDEHMAKHLPWSAGLLAVMPMLAFVLYFELALILVYFLVPKGQNPGSVMIAAQAVMLVVMLGIGFWSWRKGRPFLIAPFAGMVIAYVLSTSWTYLAEPWRQSGLHALVAPWIPLATTSRPDDPINSWLVLGPWVVVVLAFLPLVALLTWWGRLAGSLALLGGVSVVTAFVWVDSPMSWLKLLAYLAVCLGLVTFVVAPRGRQATVAWVVLLVDWAIIALGKWYFIVFEAPHAMNAQWRSSHLPTLEGVWGEMPLAVLTFSIALLLMMQILFSARSDNYRSTVTASR